MSTYYVTQDGAGSGNGSSLANAFSVVAFNTGSNWSGTPGTANKISPGDTVSLNGTITSQLVPPGSGSSGNRITLLFAAGAKLSSPAWSSTGAINIDAKHYLTVDGDTTGIIECTDNGTGLTYQSGSHGIRVFGANHVHIQNLIVRNLYVRTDTTDSGVFNTGIGFSSLSGGSYTGAKVLNCSITHAETAIKANIRLSATSIEVANNTIQYCSDGIIVATGGINNTGSGITIYGNRVRDWANWDDTTGGGTGNLYHHDGIHVFATQSGSTITDVKCYSNDIGPGYGGKATSGIYYSGRIFDGLIYNNIIRGDTGAPANGLITLQLFGTSNVGVYNNTIYGSGFETSNGRAIHHNNQAAGGIELTIKNNLIINVAFAHWIIWRDNAATRVIDRNFYYGLGNGFNWSASESQAAVSFAYWQGTLGFDVNGSNGVNPSLAADYTLEEASPARGAGENLYSIFTTDAAGNARPSSGAWDVGAYQYGSAPPPPDPDPEPTPSAPGKRRRGAKLLGFL